MGIVATLPANVAPYSRRPGIPPQDTGRVSSNDLPFSRNCAAKASTRFSTISLARQRAISSIASLPQSRLNGKRRPDPDLRPAPLLCPKQILTKPCSTREYFASAVRFSWGTAAQVGALYYGRMAWSVCLEAGPPFQSTLLAVRGERRCSSSVC